MLGCDNVNTLSIRITPYTAYKYIAISIASIYSISMLGISIACIYYNQRSLDLRILYT